MVEALTLQKSRATPRCSKNHIAGTPVRLHDITALQVTSSLGMNTFSAEDALNVQP